MNAPQKKKLLSQTTTNTEWAIAVRAVAEKFFPTKGLLHDHVPCAAHRFCHACYGKIVRIIDAESK